MSMTAQAIYGGPKLVDPAKTSPAGAPPTGAEARLEDPHDKADRGPASWFEDPVIVVCLLFGLATGIVGFRFKWWGGGADAGVRVNLGDEVGALVGTTLYAITGIILFKVGASKIPIPAVQRVAAAI